MTPGAWLESRLEGAPVALRDAVGVQRAAFSVQRGGEDVGFGEVLRGRAEELIAEARDGVPARETALTLLAADALITLACEWTAEMAPERLEELE